MIHLMDFNLPFRPLIMSAFLSILIVFFISYFNTVSSSGRKILRNVHLIIKEQLLQLKLSIFFSLNSSAIQNNPELQVTAIIYRNKKLISVYLQGDPIQTIVTCTLHTKLQRHFLNKYVKNIITYFRNKQNIYCQKIVSVRVFTSMTFFTFVAYKCTGNIY